MRKILLLLLFSVPLFAQDIKVYKVQSIGKYRDQRVERYLYPQPYDKRLVTVTVYWAVMVGEDETIKVECDNCGRWYRPGETVNAIVNESFRVVGVNKKHPNKLKIIDNFRIVEESSN